MIRDDGSRRKFTLKQVLEILVQDSNTAETARQIGISRVTLSRFLNGRNQTMSFTIPQVINLKRMIEPYGLTLEDLLGFDESPPPK